MIFALCSVPIVIIDVPSYDPRSFTYVSDSPRLSLLDPAVLVASFGAVLSAAVVAGSIGGWVARRHLILGASITITIAWFTAIAALPVAPALLGLPYGAVNFCIDGCNLQITGADTGLRALPGWFLSWIYAPWSLAALVMGTIIWARIVHRTSTVQARPPTPVPPTWQG